MSSKKAADHLRLVRAVRDRLSLELLFGWEIPITWPPRRESGISPPAASTERGETPPVGGADMDAERERRARLLQPIAREVSACQACSLFKGRRQTVFGVGDPCARLMFVGEGPGEEEDRQGEPFVGRAGQLLTRMIRAMGLSREEVYIANIVKCRPPGNRNPAPREIIACFGYLQRQVEIIAPEVICGMGNVAVRALLSTQRPISRLRGHWADFQGIPLLPTFHPSYLLRNPTDKRLVWQDLQTIMERLGLKISA